MNRTLHRAVACFLAIGLSADQTVAAVFSPSVLTLCARPSLRESLFLSQALAPAAAEPHSLSSAGPTIMRMAEVVLKQIRVNQSEHWYQRRPRRTVAEKVTLRHGSADIGELRFAYDDLGQLEKLDVDWRGRPEAFENGMIDLGEGRRLHMTLAPAEESPGEVGRFTVPRLWIESPGAPPWLFSGFDLEESFPADTHGISSRMKGYVTISHFTGADGRVIPAGESFDHDEVPAFLHSLNLPGKDTTLVNIDFHPDAQTWSNRPRLLHIANWGDYIKKAGQVGELLWLKALWLGRPEKKGIIDSYTTNSFKIRPHGLHVVFTWDLDFFSGIDRYRTAPDIRRRVAAVVASLLGPGRDNDIHGRLAGVNVTRSSYGRQQRIADYGDEPQSNFILNAVISEHQRHLGDASLRVVPFVTRTSGAWHGYSLDPLFRFVLGAPAAWWKPRQKKDAPSRAA